jgi:hypothetical protein
VCPFLLYADYVNLLVENINSIKEIRKDVLKWLFRKLIQPTQHIVVDTFEHGNEPSSSISARKFLDQLSDW